MKMNENENLVYNDTAIELSSLLNSLSHPARLQIVMHLAKYNGCTAGSISKKFPLAKSTVSEHLNKLKEVGLITCSPSGVCQNYQLNDEVFNEVKMHLLNFIKQIDDQKDKREGCCY
jgi:DNA-binding transcriptional ArsR family regulator